MRQWRIHRVNGSVYFGPWSIEVVTFGFAAITMVLVAITMGVALLVVANRNQQISDATKREIEFAQRISGVNQQILHDLKQLAEENVAGRKLHSAETSASLQAIQCFLLVPSGQRTPARAKYCFSQGR